MGRLGLVGRDEQLARLVGIMTGSHARVASITGPVGVGKSALLAAGVAAVAGDGTGVWPADLSVATPGSPLLDEIARALGVWPARASAGSSLEVLAGMIGSGRVVIAVDHADAAAFDSGIGELVAQCPRLTIVVASRRPPTAVFDARLPLGPLAVPAAGATLEEIWACPSVRLFVELAERVSASPVLGSGASGDLDAVAEICRLLGGLPLAIELAAARVRLLPPTRLARQLGTDAAAGLDLLTGAVGDRTVGIREVLAETRALLTPAQDELLVLLSGFRGPFPLGAAADVSGRPLGDLLDDLGRLVDLRLVEPFAEAGFEPVLTMLPIVRAFAHEKAGDGARVAARTDYVRRLAKAAAEGMSRLALTDEVQRLRIMRREATEHLRDLVETDIAAAAQFAVDIAPSLEGFAEGVTVGEVLDGLLRTGAIDRLDTRLRAAVWLWASRMLALSPDGVQHADLVAERWMRGKELVDDERWPLFALQARMIAVYNGTTTGDLRFSVQAAVEGSALARASAQPVWIARFEVLAAGAANQMGESERAVALALSSLERAQRVQDPAAIALATTMINTLPLELFDPRVPIPSLDDGLAIVRRLGDAMTESFMLAALTMREHRAGRLAHASHWCEERLELGRRRGWTVLAFMSFMHCALIAGESGDVEFAARMIGVVRLDLERVLRSMAPSTRPLYEETVARTCASIGEARFAALAAEGAMLSAADATAAAIEWLRRRGTAAPPVATTPQPVTAREQEVLELLASGLTNKEIAARLGLAVKTVMHHSVSIYRKLGVRGRAEATAHAYRHGLLSDVGSR